MIDNNFLEHKFIKTIKNNRSWSISDNNKRPISMKGLKSGKIYGAKFSNSEDLETANGVIKTIKMHDKTSGINNLAYYLNSTLDGFLIIDIEKICPEEIKQDLLKIPYEYAEYSRSGTGIHLVCKVPEKYKFNRDFNRTKVLKYKQDFEILMNHWVTFTGNQIKEKQTEKNPALLEEIINKLLTTKKDERVITENLSVFNKIDKEIIDKETDKIYDMPHRVEIEKRLRRHHYNKTLKDFVKDKNPNEYDQSKYDFGMCGFYNNKLKNILKSYNDYEYTDKEIIYFLQNIMKEKMPFREKHNEKRGGIPYLAHIAKRILEKEEIMNNIISNCVYMIILYNKNGKEITLPMLQKMIFLTEGLYMYQYNQVLYNYEPLASAFGPYYSEIQNYFKKFEINEIDLNKTNYKYWYNQNHLSEEQIKCLNKTYELFNKFNNIQLCNITKYKNTEFENAYNENRHINKKETLKWFQNVINKK